MAVVVDKSFMNLHKEGIYRALENEAQALGFKLMLERDWR
jgi:hypothetical protein